MLPAFYQKNSRFSARCQAAEATVTGGVAETRLTGATPVAVTVRAGAEGLGSVTVSVKVMEIRCAGRSEEGDWEKGRQEAEFTFHQMVVTRLL